MTTLQKFSASGREGGREGERESNWMGTPTVSPLKTQNALSSAVGLREKKGRTVKFYNASYARLPVVLW